MKKRSLKRPSKNIPEKKLKASKQKYAVKNTLKKSKKKPRKRVKPFKPLSDFLDADSLPEIERKKKESDNGRKNSKEKKREGRKASAKVAKEKERKSSKSPAEKKRRARKQAQKPTRQEKSRPYKIVPLHPSTGKTIRQPKTGQEVTFGIKDEKGRVTRIETRFSQRYSKSDHNGLQKIIDRTGKKDFVVYEQLTSRKFIDPKSGLIRQAEKITFGKKDSSQRPVLYAHGKRIRELDLGFRQRGKREMVDDMLLTALKPDGKFTRDIKLEGHTIKDTIKNLPLKLTMAQIQKYELEGVFYEIVLRIRGEEPVTVYGKTDTYANMSTDISRSIRYALGNRGFRFTSLVTLHDLAAEAEESGDDEMVSKLLHVGAGRVPVNSLNPIYQENEFGYDVSSRRGTDRVTMDIKISGIG